MTTMNPTIYRASKLARLRAVSTDVLAFGLLSILFAVMAFTLLLLAPHAYVAPKLFLSAAALFSTACACVSYQIIYGYKLNNVGSTAKIAFGFGLCFSLSACAAWLLQFCVEVTLS